MSAPPVEPFQRTTSTQSSGDDTEWAAAVVDDAARALVAIVEAAREQARTRLSTSQLEALLVVEDKEGLNLGALAERMGVLLSSASRLCDRLVAAGMLERAASPVDRREVILTLTANGRALLEDLRADRRGRDRGRARPDDPDGPGGGGPRPARVHARGRGRRAGPHRRGLA
jgi:DNA-binding MarR family transcriptional regulator